MDKVSRPRLRMHSTREWRKELMKRMAKATNEQKTAELNECFNNANTTVTELKLLVTLGADPTEICLENARNPRTEQKFVDFFKHAQAVYDAQWNSKCVLRGKTRSESKLIALSLDGGGTRGLVSVTTLLFISRRLCGDESFTYLINWIAGTSTGSILALGIAKGLSLTECFLLYMKCKDEVFVSGLWGLSWRKKSTRQSENLEKILWSEFSDECDSFYKPNKMGIRLTVPAIDINPDPEELIKFRNYDLQTSTEYGFEQQGRKSDILFWEGARASSAAPYYFDPFDFGERCFVDGGMSDNCPVALMFCEYDLMLKHGNEFRKFACVLSIGTGSPSKVDTYGKSTKGFFTIMAKVAKVFYHKATDVNMTIDRVDARCNGSGIPFYRFSTEEVNVSFVEQDDMKLIDMIWETQVQLLDDLSRIDDMGAKLLLALDD